MEGIEVDSVTQKLGELQMEGEMEVAWEGPP